MAMPRLKLRPGALPPGTRWFHPDAIIATGFGSGLMPIASGTWGSAVALPIGWALHQWGGAIAVALGALVATLAGWWAAERLGGKAGIRDPGFIVIDEIAGQLIALAFVPAALLPYLLAFLLFRAADIFKPFPANWCDARLHGGLGVMLDDLVAGLYAGIAAWLVLRTGVIDHVLRSLGLAG